MPSLRPADQLLGLINALDRRKHAALHVAAEAQRQLEQLPRPGHVFRSHDPRHAQVDPLKVVDRTGLFHQRLGLKRPRTVNRTRCRGPGTRRSRGHARLGLGTGGDHGVHLASVHTLHHVLEFAHRSAQQRLPGLVPARDGLTQQFAGLPGQAGQHGRQIHGQLAEQVEPHGTHLLKLLAPRRVFAQLPGSPSLDVLVGPIARGQDQAHGPGIVAAFVCRGNGLAVLDGPGEQSTVVRIGGRETGFVGESGGAAGQVDHIAHHVGVDLFDELLEVHVDVVHAVGELRGIVVAQVGRIEMFQVGRGHHKRALALRHLLAVDREKAVDVNLSGQAETRYLEHGRPEKRMKIRDVLANEVVDFGSVAGPPLVEILALTPAPLEAGGDIADRRVEPHIPVVAR